MNAPPQHSGPSQSGDVLCPFCGKVLEHTAVRCERCRMLLDEPTCRSLERLMGPWFILDEGIPSAPGVTWQKFRTLIAKGKVQRDSIVRGPATGGLWTRAEDAPSVAAAMGLCWKCHSPQPPDPAARQCIACSAALHGATGWSDVAAANQPAASQAAAEAPSAIDDLIQARPAAARAGNRTDWAPRRSSSAGTLLALLIVAALAGGVGFLIHRHLTANREPKPFDESPAAGPRPPSRGAGDRENYVEKVVPHTNTAELYPGTPFESNRPTQPAKPPEPPADPFAEQKRQAQAAYEDARKALTAGDLAAAQDLLVKMINSTDSRALPAGAMATLKDVQAKIVAAAPKDIPPEELEKLKAAAAETLTKARDLADKKQLMEAQKLLVDMLNSTDRRAWPKGAVDALADIQGQVRKSSLNAPVPKPSELLRQRESAEKLFAEAQALMGQGNYEAAQEPLLKILNQHHPKAWPDGAQDAYQKIQDAFRKSPTTTRPKFFEIEAE